MGDRPAARRYGAELAALAAKINALLPPQYQDCYDDVGPSSMGSAGLRFGPDGKVAWDEIWTSYCDLALAGGPAHRGTLLEAVSADEALADPERYREVAAEIGRGVRMVTGLEVLRGETPGWVAVRCDGEAMAGWLVRAVVVENVFARSAGSVLHLPAGPHFRLHKEVKNVITALAKTHHYWAFHMPAGRPTVLGALVGPATPAEAGAEPDKYNAVVDEIARRVREATGLSPVPSPSLGWVGVRCRDEAMAVWLMRAVLVEDVLARREGEVLYLPAAPHYEPDGEILKVVTVFGQAFRYWTARAAAEVPAERE
jgi:sirohydrochlorin cobaltochelatase